jgi:hypothetical protein
LRLALVPVVMIFMNSCSFYHESQSETINKLWVNSLPAFPAPSESIVDELKEACPSDKCHAIYEWLDKLMKYEKQMALYNEQ